MSTVYAQRSSAVRAAKKACGPDQEWAIRMSGTGFTFVLLNIDQVQPEVAANKLGNKLAVTEPADRMAVVDEFAKVTEEQHKAHRAQVDRDSTKPWQRAKCIISDCIEGGITSRKEIIAHCVSAGIKYNTADGAHYEMCVKGKAKS